MEELMYIQSKLHAPKDAYNQFGKYKYRKAEQILEAAKPLLAEKGCTLVVSDDVVSIGSNIYIKATSTLTNKDGKSVQAVGWAREADQLSGMSPGQVTGATSSYARKYSLCGLFAIDDTKDLDDEEVTNPQQGQQNATVAKKATKSATKPSAPVQMQAVPVQEELSLDDAKKQIDAATTKEQLAAIFNANKHLQNDKDFIGALSTRKNQILNNNGTAAS